MGFVQIIEYRTTHLDELNAVMDRWMAETAGKRTATRTLIGADRDRADTYVDIVEFPSYEEAMRNSSLPETAKYAEQITALCEGDPVFHNFDVVREEKL